MFANQYSLKEFKLTKLWWWDAGRVKSPKKVAIELINSQKQPIKDNIWQAPLSAQPNHLGCEQQKC